MFSETASGADEPPEGGDNFVTDPFDGIEGGNAVCRPSSPCSRNDQGKWPFRRFQLCQCTTFVYVVLK